MDQARSPKYLSFFKTIYSYKLVFVFDFDATRPIRNLRYDKWHPGRLYEHQS